MENHRLRVLVIILVAMLTILLALLISITFKFQIIQNLVMSWILTSIFCVFAIFMVEPRIAIVKQIKVETPVYIEKPVEVIKEVPVQIPVENKTVEFIEKPVIKEVVRYVESPKKRLNIPKFKFVASKQTRTFHKKSCRLGKLIKKKYKVHSNVKAFFKKRHFKACKACIKRK